MQDAFLLPARVPSLLALALGWLVSVSHVVFRRGLELTASVHSLISSFRYAIRRRPEVPVEPLWKWPLHIQMSDLGSRFPRWGVPQTMPRYSVPNDQVRHRWAYYLRDCRSTFRSAVRVSSSSHQFQPRVEMELLAIGLV